MTFVAALSEHPVAAAATGEVIGQVAEALAGARPDLVVFFVTPPHVRSFGEVHAAVHELLSPRCLLGASAVAVLGGAREVEERPALSVWAASDLGAVTPVRLEVLETPSGTLIAGLPSTAAGGDGDAGAGAPDGATAGGQVLLLLSDPFTFPSAAFLQHLEGGEPPLRVVGGLASAAYGPGGNRLVLDDRIYTDGAVGALLPADVDVSTVVSQGCRPVGQPYTVTRAEGHLLHELGGRPALARLQDLVEHLPPEERQLLAQGVHLGRVIDEHKIDFQRGDFLIRGVMGADPSSGTLAIGDELEVGATVQFQVRDAASADDDLRALLSGQDADGALVFTCNGRGARLFGEPDHDASVVSELTGTAALGGMFCAGELGPVGGRTFLHGFTASMALFHRRDRSGTTGWAGAEETTAGAAIVDTSASRHVGAGGVGTASASSTDPATAGAGSIDTGSTADDASAGT
jgi:small ligand-binding sensory domain FIST